MSTNEEENNYGDENADYEASFANYNLAEQEEFDEALENPDAGREASLSVSVLAEEVDGQSTNERQTNDDENDYNSNNNNEENEEENTFLHSNVDPMEVPENHKDDEIENERKYDKEEDDDDDDDDNSNSDGRRRKEDLPTHHYSEPIKYDNQPESSSGAEKITEPLHSASASKHDDDERKIFVGGLHWETTVNDLRDYFSKFGKVVDSTLKTDPATGRSRGFGFVLFENVEAVDKVCDEKSHVLQGKTIDPKRAMSRLNNVTSNNKDPVKKIFVGGVSPDMPEAEIRSYFCKYGKIEEVELPFDRLKNQRRAYVFITFESEKIAEEACALPKQKLGEREVDVRRATPRAENEMNRTTAAAAARGRGVYDYSAYYNYAYPGYPGYAMPPGYDYSSYYGQDWSQYNQYAAATAAAHQYAAAYPTAAYPTAAYPTAAVGTMPGTAAAAATAVPSAGVGAYGYDYSSWYGQQDAAGKAKRGPTTTATPYHPYNR